MENGNNRQRKSSNSEETTVKTKRQMKKTSDAINRADDYCKRIRNGELVITSEAENISLSILEGTDRFGRPKKQEHSLTFLIAKRMTEYQSIRDTVPIRTPRHITPDPQFRVTMEHVRRITDYQLEHSALDLLEMIDQANTHGVLKEENLRNKLKEYQNENSRLEEENDKLQKECQRLKELNEALHKNLDRFGARTGNIEKSDKPRK